MHIIIDPSFAINNCNAKSKLRVSPAEIFGGHFALRPMMNSPSQSPGSFAMLLALCSAYTSGKIDVSFVEILAAMLFGAMSAIHCPLGTAEARIFRAILGQCSGVQLSLSHDGNAIKSSNPKSPAVMALSYAQSAMNRELDRLLSEIPIMKSLDTTMTAPERACPCCGCDMATFGSCISKSMLEAAHISILICTGCAAEQMHASALMRPGSKNAICALCWRANADNRKHGHGLSSACETCAERISHMSNAHTH